MTTENLTHSALLQGLPKGTAINRILPLQVVLDILTPQIQMNDPTRAQAIPAFSSWLREREVDVTIDQAAWLWVNYTKQFLLETPRRITQWWHARGKGERKNPFVLVSEQLEAWRMMKLTPIVKALDSTRGGRLLKKVLRFLAVSCVFLFVLVFSTVVIQLLQESRAPVHMFFMLLGLA